jgi:hypothetical protein
MAHYTLAVSQLFIGLLLVSSAASVAGLVSGDWEPTFGRYVPNAQKDLELMTTMYSCVDFSRSVHGLDEDGKIFEDTRRSGYGAEWSVQSVAWGRSFS